MNLEIPVGLTTLLQDFTVAVLRERPADLIKFAADYFKHLNSEKSKSNSRTAGKSLSCRSAAFEDDEEPFEPPNMKNRFAKRKSVAAERYDPEADDDDSEPRACYPKSDIQRKRLGEAIKPILIFRSLDAQQMNDVLDAMFEKKVEPGDHIIDQGADGDNFYVIDSGKYDIFVEVDGKPKNVGGYDNKGSFGELALMYNMPRAATIIATTNGVLWAMDRKTFRRIVMKSAFNKRKMYEALLEGVPMLSTMNTYERMNVADALVTRSYGDGEQIIKQGDDADCMYFVEDGETVVKIRKKDGSAEQQIATCNKGQYFGELALVTHKPRAASVYAVGDTKCAVLDVNAFERLLGPCMDLMKRNISDYENQLEQVFGSKKAISDLR